jgi:hypothetical protein
MSWKAEVVADNTEQFCGNALRFASKLEAEQYVMDLMFRWVLVRKTRTLECEDPVNAEWKDGKLMQLQ